MRATAQQLVDRLAFQLPLQVPHGSFDSVEYDYAKAHAAPEVAAVVHPLPELRNIIHALPQQDGLEELHNLRDNLWIEIASIGLAQTDDADIRMDLNEGSAPDAARLREVGVQRAGAGQQFCSDIGNLHLSLPFT